MTAPTNPVGQIPADFSEYVRILRSRARLLISFVGTACVLAVALSLIGPETYRAEVSLLPEESRAIALPRVGGGGGLMDFLALGGGRRESQLFLEMLSSRSVLEGVIRQVGLIERFSLDNLPKPEAMEQAIKRLKDAVEFTETEAGMLRVEMRAVTPFFPGATARRRAADLSAAIANAFADQLNRVNQEKSTSRARAVRQYLEGQIASTEERSRALSDSLVRSQIENRAVALDEQTRAAIDAAADLRGRILVSEVELGILRRTMRSENPRVHAVETELEELRKQYDRMEYGSAWDAVPRGPDAASGGNAPRDFQVPFAHIPIVAQEQQLLIRDLKVQQTVFELLNEQYYQAKIQETGDVPSLTVLDSAVPPVYRSWPQRKMLLLSTFLLSSFVALLLAFSLEYRDRRRGSPVPIDRPAPRP